MHLDNKKKGESVMMHTHIYLFFWISHFGDSGTNTENMSINTAGIALPAYTAEINTIKLIYHLYQIAIINFCSKLETCLWYSPEYIPSHGTQK
jgi:hypothetical protein